jgi:hypothetical protein
LEIAEENQAAPKNFVWNTSEGPLLVDLADKHALYEALGQPLD